MNTLISRYDPKAHAEQQVRIIETIKLYQSKHRGLSPTDQMIAKETGLSPGQVAYQIHRLEDAGKLFVTSHWPRTIMWPKGEEPKDESPRPANETKVSELRETGVSKPVLEKMKEETMEEVKRDSRGHILSERMTFSKRAKQMAKALLELENRGDKGGVLVLSKMVYGVAHTGYSSTIIKRMEEAGWVTHSFKKQNDISLTPKGKRELLGVDIADDGHELSLNQINGRKRWEGVSKEDMRAHMALMRERAAAAKRGSRKQLSEQASVEGKKASEAIMPELTERQKLETGKPFNPGKALEEAVFGDVFGEQREVDHPETKRRAAVADKRGDSDNIMVPVNPREIARSLSDLDLVLELSERGYRVTRL